MKRLLVLLLAGTMAFVLTACGSSKYMITTKAGETYISDGAPEYNMKTSTYTFNDDKGKKVILNKEDIQVMKEK